MNQKTKLSVIQLIASTVDFVISNSSINMLVNGSIAIDESFNPSFHSGKTAPKANVLAFVHVSDLESSEMLKMASESGIEDVSILEPFIDQLVYEITSAFENKVISFRTLP